MFVDQSSTGATNGDSYETTFSAEARYLWKPRYTLLAEFRHVLVSYPDSSSLDSTTEVLLLGTELRLSARLSATVRLGESIRIFDESGDSSSSPYGEALLTYRIGPTSNFQWNSRFGYEEPPGVGSEVLSYRTTLNYFKSFTPRLSLATGITGVSRNITFSGQSDETEQTIDANIGLEYRYSRQLTLNANFSFTKIITTSGFRDYDRSRIFIGAEYEF
jgi:Putative beta-barrel porin 2